MKIKKVMFGLLSVGLITITACNEETMQQGATSEARALNESCDLT